MDSIDINKIIDDKKNNNSKNYIHRTNIKEKSVRFSFYITYAFLMTTATITFIEAMRTKDIKIRYFKS